MVVDMLYSHRKLQRRGEKIGSLPGIEPGYTVG
jgi:hypothetical protein